MADRAMVLQSAARLMQFFPDCPDLSIVLSTSVERNTLQLVSGVRQQVFCHPEDRVEAEEVLKAYDEIRSSPLYKALT